MGRGITPGFISILFAICLASHPASLTFGGDNHDILFVTTIGGEYDGERDGSPQAGGLFTIRDLGIQGLAEKRFAG